MILFTYNIILDYEGEITEKQGVLYATDFIKATEKMVEYYENNFNSFTLAAIGTTQSVLELSKNEVKRLNEEYGD